MNILAIDTSTRALVLGLKTGAQLHVDERLLERSHSQEILPGIARLLGSAGVSKNELDLIVYGQGPGSFTGLRIGIGVVQGLAHGLNIPVVGVSTLACLAQQAKRRDQVDNAVVTLLARQEEVYFGAYQLHKGNMVLTGEEAVLHARKLPKLDATCAWYVVGNCGHLKTLIEEGIGTAVSGMVDAEFPCAEDLLTLGISVYEQYGAKPALEARPQYLREKVANKPGEM